MADWTPEEVDIILADYFDMLVEELNGNRFNKAAHNRQVQKRIDRSEGAIEYKHQNISAALFKLNQPWIDGYKPAHNYQKTVLDPKVAAYLIDHPHILELFKRVATQPIQRLDIPKIDFNKFVEPAPEKSEEPLQETEPTVKQRRAIKLDYFEIERANRSLGVSGEELAMEFEKWRLINAGKEGLAEKIEWVSRDQGDGLGFDILSREIDGTDRYIEVKTTKQGRDTPIFFSRNEYEFANENHDRFFLYRVFDFKRFPRMFIISGNFDDFCKVTPWSYKGLFVGNQSDD